MITDLRLQNFRSYGDSSFELNSGVNIVVGPNASGKTNLLEAVLVLAKGSSYRVKDAELIKFKKDWARLDGNLSSGGHRTVKIIAEPKADKTYEIDGRPYKRLTLNNSLPVVLFEPNHLLLLSGGPERRRDYVDDLLEQTIPGFGSLRRQYKRALAQRNALLKNHGVAAKSQIFPWDLRLSELAGQIVRSRSNLITDIDKLFINVYNDISASKTKVNISYDTTWPMDSYQSHLLKKLESNIETDALRGFTSAGPHREDIKVTFNNKPSQEVASRGEVRTAILALKIIELQIIRDFRDGKPPILLLDDVFSELDGRRRHALTDRLASYQTFITTTDADIVTKHFTDSANVIALS